MPAQPEGTADPSGRQAALELRCRELERERDEALRRFEQLVGTSREAIAGLEVRSDLLRGILTALHETVIFGLDRAGTYLFSWADPEIERRTGMESARMLGRRLVDVFPPEVAEMHLATVRMILETGQPFRAEVPMTLPTGEYWWDLALAPLRNSEGEITGSVGVARDVTERRREEEQRRRLESRIVQTQKLESLALLSAGVAHDFNNLLLAILGNSELLRGRLSSLGEAQEDVDAIVLAARRAADLVRQLLAYAGRGQLALGPVALGELAAEMVEIARASVPRKIDLRYDLPMGLPPVRGDATQLRQVMLNLIVNASEAIGQQEGTIALRVRTVEACPPP